MDRTLDVRTPESIAFSYELAGLGSRFLAVTLDLVIQIAALLLLFFGLIYAGAHVGTIHETTKSPIGERLATNIVYGFLYFIVFAIMFGYFILFEAFGNGQTIGKKALGIRVVRDGGYPVGFTASMIRNVIRVGEMAFGMYAISAICTILSSENKRVGDIAAGTIVVRDSTIPGGTHTSFTTMMRDVLANEPVYASTGFVSGEERALIHRFIERRDRLDPQRRQSIAAQLAMRVRDRVPSDLKSLPDEALLERL